MQQEVTQPKIVHLAFHHSTVNVSPSFLQLYYTHPNTSHFKSYYTKQGTSCIWMCSCVCVGPETFGCIYVDVFMCMCIFGCVYVYVYVLGQKVTPMFASHTHFICHFEALYNMLYNGVSFYNNK